MVILERRGFERDHRERKEKVKFLSEKLEKRKEESRIKLESS